MRPQKTESQKSGTALGGFLMVLGFTGVFLTLQLLLLPAGGST